MLFHFHLDLQLSVDKTKKTVDKKNENKENEEKENRIR